MTSSCIMSDTSTTASEGAPAATKPTVTASTHGGPGSCRTPGRDAGGGVFCARRPSYVSCSTSSCCASRRDTTPGPALWCRAGARAAATLSCSCVATTSAGVVPSGGGHWLCRRPHRVQPSATRLPAWVRTKKNGLLTTQGNACLCKTPGGGFVVVVWCCVVLL